jgi:hypothetical protein
LNGSHCLDHPPAADAHDVADHRVELDVGFFEGLLNPLDVPGLLARQLLAGAQQRAQFLHLLLGNEARLDQPATHQIGDPHGVIHVRLAARNGSDQGLLETGVEYPERRHVRADTCQCSAHQERIAT